MSLTVEVLNKSIIKGSSIKDLVKEQLLIIDKQIQRADKCMGENTVVFNLPVLFPGLPTDNHISRTIVYAQIIQSLEERGFNCSLSIDKKTDKARLFIRWTVFIQQKEYVQLETFLATKLID